MPNSQTLTIIASPETPTQEANEFIDTANDVFAKAQFQDHILEHACDIVHLSATIGKHLAANPKLVVQILGHSISGLMELGSAWMTDEEKEKTAYHYPFFLLNSSPAALGILREHARGISELLLVGCFIGATNTNGYGINGRTLTYTLCELLQCDVYAANFEVSPKTFGPDGRYLDYKKMFTRWQWQEEKIAPTWTDVPLPESPDNNFSTATIESIVASRLPVPDRRFPRTLRAPDEIRVKRIASELHFAVPEVTVEGNWSDGLKRFALLSGGRFVRRDEQYYVVISKGTPNLAEALWRLPG
jgi:hypothetical protein